MSNTLTAIIPKILARGLNVLREQCVMPRLVNGDYSSDAAQKGATIDVPVPTAMTATEVSPSSTPKTASDHTITTVQVPLDNWYSTNFHLTDKDMVQIDRNQSFFPMQAMEAVRALANKVNISLQDLYIETPYYYGTAGSTPFNDTDKVKSATGARKILNQNLAPRVDRRGVLNYDAEANALALSEFSDAEKIMSPTVKMEGEIGRKFGIDWVADDHVRSHTTGAVAATAGIAIDYGSGYSAGVSTIHLDGFTSDNLPNVGDVFKITGDSQPYVVTGVGSSSGTETDITIYPALAAAAADDAAVTFVDSHVANMVFHRDAIAFATRPLIASTQDLALGSRIMSMQDPDTGLTLRLEVSRQNKQVLWEFDILWGCKMVRPQLACRLLG
jgi:hypothetical protein